MPVPTAKDPANQLEITKAYAAGESDGFNRAFDRNKWQVNFVRGIPVGIAFGVILLLAFQKLVLHVF